MAQKILDLLRHPMVLLLATAVISGIMVQLFTSGWQNQQKQDELKAALVGEMSQSVSEIVIATQFAVVGAESQTQQDFDRAFRDWDIARTVLAARILGVTRNSSLTADWEAFGERVTRFYAVVGYRNSPDSLEDLKSLALSSQGAECVALSRNNREKLVLPSSDPFENAWISARAAILTDLGNLINCVLE